jgi:hypothetical protein
MSICRTVTRPTVEAPARSVRVLRWTFRREEDAVVCELGLNADNSAYELRVNPAWNPVGIKTETFADAMSAFERHAAIERLLVKDGWMLEGFESEQIPRPA